MHLDLNIASRRCPVLSRASQASRARLFPHARVQTFERGATIFRHGEPAERCHVLLSGWVKLSRLRPNGDEAVIRVHKSGETFGFDDCLRDEPHRHFAQAATTGAALSLPAAAVRETIAADPGFGQLLMQTLLDEAERLQDQIEGLKALKGIERLGQFLKDHAKPKGNRLVATLPFDKSLIAAYLGMKPESLSRAFARLADHGVQVDRTEIEITDAGALDALLDAGACTLC